MAYLTGSVEELKAVLRGIAKIAYKDGHTVIVPRLHGDKEIQVNLVLKR